jgi:hypothetical protein
MAYKGKGTTLRAQQGFQKMMDERRKKVESVLDTMTKKCVYCQVSSSKRRLFSLAEGDICAQCAAEHIPVSDKTLYELEADHKVHLEAEKNKPKPETYGDWA